MTLALTLTFIGLGLLGFGAGAAKNGLKPEKQTGYHQTYDQRTGTGSGGPIWTRG